MDHALLFGLATLFLPSATPAAPPLLDWVFQDSMVLQRGVAVPLWGSAEAGAVIRVSFAGQRKETRADPAGRWRVTLAAMGADDTPRDLHIVAGKQTRLVRDVLVGEVWLAAGQSNMEWPLSSEAHVRTELPGAALPKLRLLNLTYAGQGTFARPFGPDVRKRLTPTEFYRGTWTACTPRSAQDFSAVAYYFGKKVHQSIQVPVGVIHLAVGGSPAEAWIRRQALANDRELQRLVQGNWLENARLDAWCRQRGRENLAIHSKDKTGLYGDESGPNHPFKPGFLWDAGIARLMPFPVRGVVWYQGESNSLDAARVRQHERLFPLLVADWRKQWGLGVFPFFYCQLSSIGTEKGYRAQHWPEFRDGQRRMLATIPHTGMAVTSDLGHPTDVHPRNKREVGHRLALWALARTYDRPLAYSGPLARSVRREGSSLVVSFDHADGGLNTTDGKPPRAFEIAGSDGVYVAADVSLGASTVTLTSKKVATPVSVRYGWHPYSAGNLMNGAALPASTFLLTADRAENQHQPDVPAEGEGNARHAQPNR